MTRIRFARWGRQEPALLPHHCGGQPQPRNGKFLEILGHYNPLPGERSTGRRRQLRKGGGRRRARECGGGGGQLQMGGGGGLRLGADVRSRRNLWPLGAYPEGVASGGL